MSASKPHPRPDPRDAEIAQLRAQLAEARAALDSIRPAASVTDRAERKRLEAHVRDAQKEAFRAIFDGASDGILLADMTTRKFVLANASICRMLGYSADELTALAVDHIHPAADRSWILQEFGRMSQEAIASLPDLPVQRKDGSVFHVSLGAAILTFEGKPHIAGFFRDITEQRRLDAELRALNRDLEQRVAERTAELSAEVAQRRERETQLHKLNRAVEQSPASVVITDRTGTIEYVNPQFERTSGYTHAEAVGRNTRLLRSGMHPPEFYAALWRTLEAGRTWRGEICNRRKDGSLFWESAAIAPIVDSRGQTTHYVAVKEDITASRRLAEELRQAKEAAEAASRAKSVFLARMSHEIRTPMNAVLGFTQLLLGDAATTPPQRQRLTTILHSGELLLHLINEVLEMARIEAGLTTLHPRPFALAALMRDLVAMFSLQAQSHALTFRLEQDASLPSGVLGDEAKLRQILINLLGNAFKFTPAGGQVALRLRATEESSDRVRLTVQVADTGPGVAPADAARLFEPFFQSAAGQAAGGTGLGLSISRQFARLMGGDLSARTPAEGGACFELQVPLTVVPEPVAQALLPPPTVQRLAPESAGYHVLIVDDAADSLAALAELLTTLGFTVHTAANGLEAVEACRAWLPGLVLLDLWMPVMDGYEAARRLRAAHGPALKILVLSAGADADVRLQALAAGADELLSKPPQEAALLECLRQLTGVHYLYRAAEPAPAPTAATATASPIAADAGRRLPAALLDGLRGALAIGDYDELLALSAQAAQVDGTLGARLRELLERYDYTALESVLTACDPNGNEVASK